MLDDTGLYYPTKLTIGMVFKTSNRTNAKVKIKTWTSKNLDDILDSTKKLSGTPDDENLILEVGVGKGFENRMKQKYKL